MKRRLQPRRRGTMARDFETDPEYLEHGIGNQ